MLRVAVLPTIVVLGLCGCQPDLKEFADQHVRASILAGHEKREAISFFEKQGRFFDMDETTNVDRQVVLPLLKRLNEIVSTEQWVVLRKSETKEKDLGFALLVQLPKDAGTIDRMAEAVQEADEKFSGFILQQWGREWLMMNLIDQRTYEALKRADPDIDKQR
jgi:hypothetical protein